VVPEIRPPIGVCTSASINRFYDHLRRQLARRQLTMPLQRHRTCLAGMHPRRRFYAATAASPPGRHDNIAFTCTAASVFILEWSGCLQIASIFRQLKPAVRLAVKPRVFVGAIPKA